MATGRIDNTTSAKWKHHISIAKKLHVSCKIEIEHWHPVKSVGRIHV